MKPKARFFHATSIISMLIATPAFAQQVPASERTSSDDEMSQPAPGEEIVVTGSRIARPGLDSAMPISVTNGDDMVALGATSATEMLQLEPALGIGADLSSSTGVDAGIQAINLRSLGINRSLTLIDGQRRVSASGIASEVDIGTIPIGMIDRVEVVTGGAAAIYGADAVSGAANIITKDAISGFHATVTNGISDRGDARESMISFTTGGKAFDDRLSLALGGTWSNTDPLSYPQRYGSRGQLNYVVNPENTGPEDGIPDTYVLPDIKPIYSSFYPTFWVPSLGDHFIYKNGVVQRATYTTPVGEPAEFDIGAGGDGSTLASNNLFRAQNDTKSLMGNYDFEVSPSITIGGYFSYARQKYVGSKIANGYWRDDSRTATFFSGGGGAVARLDNPYLPDTVRQFMVDNDLETLNIARRWGNFPQSINTHDRTSYTVGQTLDGKLTNDLNFNLFFQYGHVLDKATEGPVPYKDHWIAARDAIADPVTGEPICRDPAARAEGCIPFDIFSTSPQSQAVLDYVMATRHNERRNSQMVFGGSVTGAVARLPYGDLSIAAGIERRVEKLKSTDDPLALSGQLVYGGGLRAEPPLDASQRVTEEYIEVVAPVLKDVKFFKRLEIEGAYRHSDYNTVGGTDTWKGGGSWEPLSGLTFRAVRSRSVRAPNFGELYSPQTTTLTGQITDPCRIGQYNANDNRSRNCAALGIAAPGLDITRVGPNIIAGGNPDLKPETSNSLTVGLIFQPAFIPGLDVTLDYYNINITDAIQQLSYTNILNLCVDLESIDNPYCALAQRDPVSHNPTQVITANANTARLYTRGIDIGVDYRRRIGEGLLRLSLKANYLFDLVTETTPGQSSGDVQSDGGFQNPHFKASLLTAYHVGKFDLSLATRFVGASTYDLTQVGNAEAFPNNNRVQAFVYNNVSIGYNVNDRYRIGFGVKNITDQLAPYYPATYLNSSVYDMVGRYIYVTIGADL